jgi:tetratricopeptide (TPR) repeat protein
MYLVGFLFALAPLLFAQHHDQHQHGLGKVGTVRFETSCAASAQADFDHAVALLHSFWYDEAASVFRRVAEADPSCGMAWWGVAMSYYHPIWAPPSPVDLIAGTDAAERAIKTGAKTQRERDYIAAIHSFYQDAANTDHLRRAARYREAMEKVYRSYPGDAEAGILYALTLIKVSPATPEDFRNQEEAARILNAVLPKQPEHPGVAHYLIHSYDLPGLAHHALAAARSYSKIAPDSPHALHMPSHIFTRLGLWQDSIASNIASADSARRHLRKSRPDVTSFDELHAMDYLAYAYLQVGQERKAEEIVEQARAAVQFDQQNFAAAYALAAIPARYALERRAWDDAASLELRPAGFPWDKYPHCAALTDFARGIGAARDGDLASARAALASIETRGKALAGLQDPYDWRGAVEAQRLAIAAWIAHGERKHEAAVKLMKDSAALEDRTGKHPVTPGAVLPARELLGDLLLEMNRPAEALAEYEESLRHAPNRLLSLAGALDAAKAAGRQDKARTYARILEELTKDADPLDAGSERRGWWVR